MQEDTHVSALCAKEMQKHKLEINEISHQPGRYGNGVETVKGRE